MAKMEAVATPGLIEYAASLRDGLVVHPSPPKGKYKSSMFNAINRAISNAVTIELDYTTRTRDEPRRYLIQPEALVVYEGSLYIAGYRADIADQTDPRSRALHFFKLDRVSRAKTTSRTFRRRRESVASLLSDSITLYRVDHGAAAIPDQDLTRAGQVGLREAVSSGPEGAAAGRRQRDPPDRAGLGQRDGAATVGPRQHRRGARARGCQDATGRGGPGDPQAVRAAAAGTAEGQEAGAAKAGAEVGGHGDGPPRAGLGTRLRGWIRVRRRDRRSRPGVSRPERR